MLIRLSNISFDGLVKINKRKQILTKFDNITNDFASGKAYQLTSPHDSNNWALSWLIGGVISQRHGNITINGELYQQSQRRHDSWLVRFDEKKKFGFFSQSVKSQIRQGIQRHDANALSEQDLVNHFRLTPQLTNRYLRQLSSEGWRASCAVGVAYNKRIFCFPPLQSEFVETYKDSWFTDMIEFLKSLNTLVLLPTSPSTNMDGICDEVLSVDR